jgi:hypothetical protein
MEGCAICGSGSAATIGARLLKLGVISMKILLSAASGLMLLASTAAFAQSSSATTSVLLKPGQTEQQANVPAFTPSNDVGIVTMKPGETVNTVSASGLGSVAAGATKIEPNAG